jgi:hypothetical protein
LPVLFQVGTLTDSFCVPSFADTATRLRTWALAKDAANVAWSSEPIAYGLIVVVRSVDGL